MDRLAEHFAVAVDGGAIAGTERARETRAASEEVVCVKSRETESASKGKRTI